jgi:hypothetical protein
MHIIIGYLVTSLAGRYWPEIFTARATLASECWVGYASSKIPIMWDKAGD